MLELVSGAITAGGKVGQTVVVVVGRSRRMAVESHKVELRELKRGVDVSKTVGEVGAAIVGTDTNASVLVMQART
jgi:hypothetical protein